MTILIVFILISNYIKHMALLCFTYLGFSHVLVENCPKAVVRVPIPQAAGFLTEFQGRVIVVGDTHG